MYVYTIQLPFAIEEIGWDSVMFSFGSTSYSPIYVYTVRIIPAYIKDNMERSHKMRLLCGLDNERKVYRDLLCHLEKCVWNANVWNNSKLINHYNY